MNKQINNAIRRETGWIGVKVHKADGCVSFYSDVESEQYKLTKAQSTTVYVNAINQLTVDQWVDEFKYIIEELKWILEPQHSE